MKTLDEVIDDFEKACDLERRCENCSGCLGQEYGCPNDGAECVPDALHYLKELRHMLDNTVWVGSTKEENGYWKLPTLPETGNDPLTWDELNCMDGKPVWVEVDGKWWGRFWAFVEVENDSYINFFQKGQEYPEDLWKRDMGKTWNAFRKERE